jgi:carbonyl reductase 1
MNLSLSRDSVVDQRGRVTVQLTFKNDLIDKKNRKKTINFWTSSTRKMEAVSLIAEASIQCLVHDDSASCEYAVPYLGLISVLVVYVVRLVVMHQKMEESVMPCCIELEPEADPPVFLVTGSNKGLGFAIVHRLAMCLGNKAILILAARDEERGRAAVEKLKQIDCGSSVVFKKLDVTDDASVESLFEWIEEEYKGLSVLVNNAAVAHVHNVAPEDEAKECIDVNFNGTRKMSERALECMRPNGRIINIASSVGQLAKGGSGCPLAVSDGGYSELLQQQLMSADLDVEGLAHLLSQYLTDFAKARKPPPSWPPSPYAVSKTGVIQLTRVLANRVECDHPRKRGQQKSTDPLVVSCCPGLVRTDMTALTPQQCERLGWYKAFGFW